MRLTVAAVGKPRNAAIAAAIHDYEARAARYWPLDVHEVREERSSSAGSKSVRDREGDRILERIGSARLVACDPAGKSYSSEEFADLLQGERERDRDMAFAIGGAFGLSDKVLANAAMKMSLAPWTLPHELARLVLAEQIYRAGSIIRGEPYHK